MAKRFALSALLTIREQQEQAEERALAQINTRRNEIQNAIREIAKHIDQESAARLQQIGQVQPAAHHLAWEQKLKSLRGAEADMRKQLLAIEQQRKQQQDQYLLAHAGREMLTDLKKRAHGIWEKDENLQEQKHLQDFFLSRSKTHRGLQIAKRS